MRTRASSNLIAESSTTPKRRNRRHSKQRVRLFSLEESPVVTMADQRTMAELLQAPTEGYGDAIVIPAILAKNFELKHGLLNLVTSKQFYGFEKEDPHAHIRWFNKITSTIKYRAVPNSSIKLMLFPFSIEGAARIWLEKEPPRSILTGEDLVSKFINQFFPPSKTTNLQNEIMNFQQRFDESFCEAWDHFKDLLRACPHHVSTGKDSSSTLHSSEIAALVDAVKAMLHQKSSPPASVKAVVELYVTCGGPHPYHQCLATDGNVFLEYQDNIQGYVSAAAVNYNKGNTRYRPQSVANQIRPPGFAQPNVQNNQTRYNQGYNQNRGNNQGNQSYQAPIQQTQVAPLNELSNYKKINDANMKDMQNKINNMKNELRNEMKTSIQTSMSNQTNELKNMMASFFPNEYRFFFGLVECLVLADLGAIINLMPLSIWKKLSLPELTPTQMILELADRSTTSPSVDDEAITFKVGQTSRYSYNDAVSINRIDVINVDCEEYAQEVLGFSDSSTSGNPTPSLDPILSTSSPSLTAFEEGDFILEEIKACLTNDSIPPGIDDDEFDPEEDLLLLEKLLNDDPSSPLPPKELHVEDLKIVKSSIDDPSELELKDLPSHLECMMAIFHDMIEETMEDKCHFMVKEGIVLGHKILKPGIEVDKAKVDVIAKLPHPTSVKGIRSFLGHTGFYHRFIQDFSKIARPMTHLLEKDTPFIFSKECVESFNILKKKLTEDPILVAPDWDLPFEIMCDASDYAVGAVLGQHKTKHFQPIHYASKTMTDAQAHYNTTEKELLAVVYAFEKFWPYLVLSKTIMYTNHSTVKYILAKQDAKLRLLRCILLLQEYDVIIRDKKGAENLAADHLSRLENPHQDVLENKEITETFPLDTLGMITFRGDSSTLWFAYFANYHARNFVIKGMPSLTITFLQKYFSQK
ncbi:reverse transcriptase domain-containing protein [Tanacetum coccineum]|uniref:Reverse transcriptase domain-containing protein n=1 Tax=Tanacetum coccineum TaxID=301880 RepID=A0ABQ5DHW0_9ASTR